MLSVVLRPMLVYHWSILTLVRLTLLAGPTGSLLLNDCVHLGAENLQSVPKQVVLNSQFADRVLVFNVLLSSWLFKHDFQLFGGD